MSPIIYGLCSRLFRILARVGVGTNLGLCQVFFALLSGRFLGGRGALTTALADCELEDAAVRRGVAALANGRWSIGTLLAAWRKCVLDEDRFRPRRYEGYSPVACDLVGFFRPRLEGCAGKHYTSKAGKALPALVFAEVASVGSVGQTRLPLLRLLIRPNPGETEASLQRRAVQEAGRTLAKDEVLVVDAGFSLADLLENEGTSFVIRLDSNATARRDALPEYKGRGAHPKYGEIVRPLPRTYAGKKLAASEPAATATWKVGRRRVRALIFENLVLSDAKPGGPTFRIIVILDPRYKEPLVLATNLRITAYALSCLYADRWPVEQIPLAAKQMLGCERAFVFGAQSRWRLPEVAMLAGNLLSYVAACSQPVATGFWDRCARPTCGRLRRVLARMRFSDLPLPEERFRKKNSPTAHLPKGVKAHRRRKGSSWSPNDLQKAA